MTTRLIEISIELGKLYELRAVAGLKEWSAGQDVSARQLELTPDPDEYKKLGSNDTARKTALDKIFAEDKELNGFLDAQDQSHEETILVDADIQKLEAERRALEWSIRGQLVDALRAKQVDNNHRGDPAGDNAFDNVADQATLFELDF